MSIKKPKVQDQNELEAVMKMLYEFCGDAHFMINILPVFDEDGKPQTSACTLASFPSEMAIDAMKDMLYHMEYSRGNGFEKNYAVDFQPPKKMH